MAFALSDIFIGDFTITQDFGANYQTYHARYGLSGHNGTDFGCPSMTPILAAADGQVVESRFDENGYGHYIKLLHDGYLTLYAHLNDFQVQVNDRVIKGQLIGHSDNTGFSTAAHLHFGVAPCDANGNKLNPGNGFSGYIDPRGPECTWHLSNPKQPALPTAVSQTTTVPTTDFQHAVVQGTNFKIVSSFAVDHGFNNYLQSQTPPIAIVDLNANPDDSEAGQKLISWLSSLLQQNQDLSQKLQENRNNSGQTISTSTPGQLFSQPMTSDQRNFLDTFLTNIRGFIFK